MHSKQIMHSKDGVCMHGLCPSSLVLNPKWRASDKGLFGQKLKENATSMAPKICCHYGLGHICQIINNLKVVARNINRTSGVSLAVLFSRPQPNTAASFCFGGRSCCPFWQENASSIRKDDNRFEEKLNTGVNMFQFSIPVH